MMLVLVDTCFLEKDYSGLVGNEGWPGMNNFLTFVSTIDLILQLKKLPIESKKEFMLQRDSNPCPLRNRCRSSTT